MSFQIINSGNTPIPIKDLDIDACKVWNREVSKEYATPFTIDSSLSFKERWSIENKNINWFDKIGWIISNYRCHDWTLVKAILLAYFIDDNELLEYAKSDEGLGLYIKLIDHWKSLGYTPKYID